MRQVDLIDIARLDVILGPAHRRDKPGATHRGMNHVTLVGCLIRWSIGLPGRMRALCSNISRVVWGISGWSAEGSLPEIELGLRLILSAGTVCCKAGCDDMAGSQCIVEDNERGVESHLTIGQTKIVAATAGELRLHEGSQVVSPVAKAAAEWEWNIQIVRQFVAQEEVFENSPGIPKKFDSRSGSFKRAVGPPGAEGLAWSGCDERIAGGSGLAGSALQQDQTRFPAQSPGERLGGVRRAHSMNGGPHVEVEVTAGEDPGQFTRSGVLPVPDPFFGRVNASQCLDGLI